MPTRDKQSWERGRYIRLAWFVCVESGGRAGRERGTDGKKKEAGEELKWATQSTFRLLDAFDRGETRPVAKDRGSTLSASDRITIHESVKVSSISLFPTQMLSTDWG